MWTWTGDRTPRGRRLIRSFCRARGGATAVEFAMISIPFMALICAIIETATAFWAGQILDTMLSDASRQVYTGQFQTANAGTTDKTTLLNRLRTAMCQPNGPPPAAQPTTIFDCSSVKLDVTTYSQFSGSTASNPVDPKTGDWASGFGTNYTSPKASDIVIVQAAVKFPVFSTLLNPSQASFADGSRLLRSTVAFRTEPYQ